MEDRQFRNRIYWITFLFSILVIWVHSFNAELYLGATEAAARAGRLERILGEDLTDRSARLFHGVFLSVLPQFSVVPSGRQMEIPHSKHPNSLSALEFFVLCRVCGSHPYTGNTRPHRKTSHSL